MALKKLNHTQHADESKANFHHTILMKLLYVMCFSLDLLTYVINKFVI